MRKSSHLPTSILGPSSYVTADEVNRYLLLCQHTCHVASRAIRYVHGAPSLDEPCPRHTSHAPSLVGPPEEAQKIKRFVEY